MVFNGAVFLHLKLVLKLSKPTLRKKNQLLLISQKTKLPIWKFIKMISNKTIKTCFLQQVTVIDEINWCLQKGFYQQALTLIEARISFLLVEQWHVFKVNDKYNISEENNTVYYDIQDGKEPVTLNELFNAYVYKIIKPKRFRKSDKIFYSYNRMILYPLF